MKNGHTVAEDYEGTSGTTEWRIQIGLREVDERWGFRVELDTPAHYNFVESTPSFENHDEALHAGREDADRLLRSHGIQPVGRANHALVILTNN